MTKEAWINHIEVQHKVLRPSNGGKLEVWKAAWKACEESGCLSCKDRARTKKQNTNKKIRENIYRDLGLIKVRSDSGIVFWE